MGLILDYARQRGDEDLEATVMQRARDYYLEDRGCNLTFEPGGQDFLSPCLAEATPFRRIDHWAEAECESCGPKFREPGYV